MNNLLLIAYVSAMANNGCQHGQPVVQALADPWALGHLGGTGPAVPGPSKG